MPLPSQLNAKTINILIFLAIAATGAFSFKQYQETQTLNSNIAKVANAYADVAKKTQAMAGMSIDKTIKVSRDFSEAKGQLTNLKGLVVSNETETADAAFGLKTHKATISGDYAIMVDVLRSLRSQDWAVTRLAKKDSKFFAEIQFTEGSR